MEMGESAELDRLRDAWRSLSVDAVEREDCPESARLWEAVRGELDGGELRQVIEHTATCPACAEDWRLAREVGEGEVAQPTVGTSTPVLRSWRWGALAAAAAVVAMVAVGVRWQEPAESVYRTGDTVVEAPRPTIESLLADEAVVTRDDCVLSWSEIAGARYRLRATAEDLFTVIAEVDDLAEPRYRVPESSLIDLPAGAELLWRVEARLADGEIVASETFTVRVR